MLSVGSGAELSRRDARNRGLHGFLCAEILDSTGRRTREGFSLEDATTLVGDHLRAPLSWQSPKKLGALAGDEVRLRFVFREASLYVFWLAE